MWSNTSLCLFRHNCPSVSLGTQVLVLSERTENYFNPLSPQYALSHNPLSCYPLTYSSWLLNRKVHGTVASSHRESNFKNFGKSTLCTCALPELFITTSKEHNQWVYGPSCAWSRNPGYADGNLLLGRSLCRLLKTFCKQQHEYQYLLPKKWFLYELK